MLGVCCCLLFPTQGEAGSSEFPSYLLGEELWKMNTMNFPIDFYVAGFALACSAGASFSGFFTKGLDLCITVELEFLWGMEDLGLPILPSC